MPEGEPQEGYQPSEKEIQSAEEHLTETERAESDGRERLALPEVFNNPLNADLLLNDEEEIRGIESAGERYGETIRKMLAEITFPPKELIPSDDAAEINSDSDIADLERQLEAAETSGNFNTFPWLIKISHIEDRDRAIGLVRKIRSTIKTGELAGKRPLVEIWLAACDDKDLNQAMHQEGVGWIYPPQKSNGEPNYVPKSMTIRPLIEGSSLNPNGNDTEFNTLKLCRWGEDTPPSYLVMTLRGYERMMALLHKDLPKIAQCDGVFFAARSAISYGLLAKGYFRSMISEAAKRGVELKSPQLFGFWPRIRSTAMVFDVGEIFSAVKTREDVLGLTDAECVDLIKRSINKEYDVDFYTSKIDEFRERVVAVCGAIEETKEQLSVTARSKPEGAVKIGIFDEATNTGATLRVMRFVVEEAAERLAEESDETNRFVVETLPHYGGSAHGSFSTWEHKRRGDYTTVVSPSMNKPLAHLSNRIQIKFATKYADLMAEDEFSKKGENSPVAKALLARG